ncbi:GNAT family N-acetyltransferase [Stappia sp. ICDLI1TA098]
MTTSAISILPHVRPGDEAAATRIYVDALIQKLRPFFGTAEAAAGFLGPHMRRDRAVTAIRNGRIVGIAGFNLDGKGLFEPRWRDFRSKFGAFGAAIRVAGLSLLEKQDEPDCLAMDGIAVDETARGAGIGSALLEAVVAIARRKGRKTVRLDVIDTNPRARALYERHGFVAGAPRALGLFEPIFGFTSSTPMTRHVAGGTGDA